MIDVQRVLDDYGIQQKELAFHVNRSKSYINQIIKGKKKTPEYIVDGLSKLTGLAKKDIKSKYSRSTKSNVSYVGRISPMVKGVEMTIVPATSVKGFANQFNNDPEVKSNYMYHRFESPVIAFEITGSNMQESFKPGDYAICDEEYVTDVEKLENDTLYVIITDSEYILRRVIIDDGEPYVVVGDKKKLINGQVQRCYKVLSRDTRWI